MQPYDDEGYSLDEEGGYPVLSPGLVLTLLEAPSLYDAYRDELYELTPDAFEVLGQCDGLHSLEELAVPHELLEYCLLEGLLRLAAIPQARRVAVRRNETPSLRYLMVEVTERCNLRCRHCYLGEAGAGEMGLDTFRTVAGSFAEMGGLRLIVTGGEPLLHPDFERINEAVAGLSCRSVLATNGTLLSDKVAAGLNFHEVQISLDGTGDSHDALRGEGSFEAALAGCRTVRDAGLNLSIATMIHSRNLGILPEMKSLVRQLDAVAWALDIPVETGRLADNAGFLPNPAEAVPFLDLSFGEGVHEEGGSSGCGAHLACVDVEGSLLKCGYYRDLSGGPALPDLRSAWHAVPRTGIPKSCSGCSVVTDCAGGCRYRAEKLCGVGGPDSVRCLQFGMQP